MKIKVLISLVLAAGLCGSVVSTTTRATNIPIVIDLALPTPVNTSPSVPQPGHWSFEPGLITQREFSDEERLCLTQNIFFEARNQNVPGKVGVGFAVLNRSRDDRWPSDLCDVVRDKKHGKQFSWYWDGKEDVPIKSHEEEMKRWRESKRIANILTSRVLNLGDPTDGAVFYISSVAASKRRLKQFDRLYDYSATLDEHLFYK